MDIGLCLTDSLGTSESERVNKSEPMADLFNRIRLEVERRTGNSGGNTRRRFHGTIRECTLGDTSRDGDLCAQIGCNMCRIIEVRTGMSVWLMASIHPYPTEFLPTRPRR
jgi:hypothetical protein